MRQIVILASLAVTSLAMVGTSGSAFAAAGLAAGLYNSTGTVASANSNCAAVGLTAGATNNSVLEYPGAGKTGLEIWVPSGGVLQQCTGFSAVPAGGLNGFSSSSQCAIYSINGNVPAATVTFSFTSSVTSPNSGVGTTTISISDTAPVGAGCVATVDTAIVRSGK